MFERKEEEYQGGIQEVSCLHSQAQYWLNSAGAFKRGKRKGAKRGKKKQKIAADQTRRRSSESPWRGRRQGKREREGGGDAPGENRGEKLVMPSERDKQEPRTALKGCRTTYMGRKHKRDDANDSGNSPSRGTYTFPGQKGVTKKAVKERKKSWGSGRGLNTKARVNSRAAEISYFVVRCWGARSTKKAPEKKHQEGKED